MPELPEVETVRRQLQKILVGQRIKKIEKFHPKSLQGSTLQVVGKKILRVRRKAKRIIIELNGGESLLIHLKMTGQLIYNGKKNKHTRAIFELDKGKLFFNDLRKFGWIKIVKNQALKECLVKLPLDVVDKEFTVKYLEKVLKSSKRAIKLVLLDQSKIGGLGNIYVNESLFCAGVNPSTPANKVKQIKELHRCIKEVINKAIKFGGTTSADESFKNALGKPGKFQNYLKVYENKGKCDKCQTKIRKIKIGGRGTYYCPKCQL
ncbi:MAG: DNA-formamidopyrimidine glycosylase [Patescibacteria group bacterium]|mgnify:CR=1 FL=1